MQVELSSALDMKARSLPSAMRTGDEDDDEPAPEATPSSSGTSDADLGRILRQTAEGLGMHSAGSSSQQQQEQGYESTPIDVVISAREPTQKALPEGGCMLPCLN